MRGHDSCTRWGTTSGTRKYWGTPNLTVVLVDIKLRMSQQCAPTAKKAGVILGCMKQNTDSRSNEVILPLYPPTPGAMYPVLGLSVQERCRCTGKSSTEGHQMLKGLKHLSYEENLKVLGLLSLENQRLKETSSVPVNTWSEGTKRMETSFCQCNGNEYKLKLRRCSVNIKKHFCAVQIV